MFDAGRLAERVARASLSCVSAEGFEPPPPPLPRRPLTDDSVVRADPEADIAWIDRDGQNRTVAANGHAFTTSLNRAQLRDLLCARRTPTRVIELPLSGRTDTRSMLEALESVGGISRAD